MVEAAEEVVSHYGQASNSGQLLRVSSGSDDVRGGWWIDRDGVGNVVGARRW